MNFAKSFKRVLFFCTLVLLSALTYGQSSNNTKKVDPRESAINSNVTVYQNNSQSKLALDVRRHFGGMKYGGVNYLRNSRSSYKAVKGKGSVRTKAGKTITYKFLVLSDDKGDVGGVYIGTSNARASWNMTMTHGAANQNLARCKQRYSSGTDRYKTCINNLVAKALGDCLLSSYGDADCAEQCWFNVSLCNK